MRDILLGQRWVLHRLFVLLAAAILVAWFSPLDVVMGDISRLAYLHGAMVWVALICLSAGGLLGLAHLVTNQEYLYGHSQSLVRAGLLFWIGYLPLSMWTARLAWSQVFLAEPRYAMAITVAIVGLSFQVGASLLESTRLGGLLNAFLALIVWILLVRTPLVVHPAAPIRASQSWDIKLFFFALVTIGLFVAVQVGYLLTGSGGKQTIRPQLVKRQEN